MAKLQSADTGLVDAAALALAAMADAVPAAMAEDPGSVESEALESAALEPAEPAETV